MHSYGAEVLPMSLRSKVMGLAAASHFIVNVGITEAGPTAFANIGEVSFDIQHTKHLTSLTDRLELLLCLRRMRPVLPGRGLLLLPVSHLQPQP